MDDNLFNVGDTVLCPSESGKEELMVVKVVPVPAAEQHLVLHSQWVIVKNSKGAELPSKSGHYFVKVAGKTEAAKWFIWTLWANDHGVWQMQAQSFESEDAAAPEKLLLQMTGYMVKVLPGGTRP